VHLDTAVEAPRQLVRPASGGERPTRVRSNVVLPLPFCPFTCSHSPASSANASPSKRRRSPREQASSLALSIAVRGGLDTPHHSARALTRG
jgi:hypothetical protein